MDIIILVIISVILVSMCVSVVLTIYTGVQYSYGEQESPKWKCTRVSPDKDDYVVSRIRNNDAECIYPSKGAGCYYIKQKYMDKEKTEVDYTDLKKQCSNFTQNFPEVKVAGKTLDLDVFTCGESKDSTHFKLYKNSGYDDPQNDCAIIKRDRSPWMETMRIMGLAPYTIPTWA